MIYFIFYMYIVYKDVEKGKIEYCNKSMSYLLFLYKYNINVISYISLFLNIFDLKYENV